MKKYTVVWMTMIQILFLIEDALKIITKMTKKINTFEYVELIGQIINFI